MNSEIKIWVVSLFPQFFDSFKDCGIIGKLLNGERGRQIRLNILNPADFCQKNFKGVDGSSYGGGPGMVMRADVLKATLEKGIIEQGVKREDLTIIYLSPRGKQWSRTLAKQMATTYWNENTQSEIVLICGRYEGVDERFITKYVDFEYSIGDFVLSGGEIAAMAILDSALRFTPGALGNGHSLEKESFEDCLLDHPHYTRPENFEGLTVPKVLLSGHHEKIDKYRDQMRLEQTQIYRPELL